MKRTYQPSKLVRKRRHGFRSKMRTKGGRKTIARRRKKGRKKLSTQFSNQMIKLRSFNDDKIFKKILRNKKINSNNFTLYYLKNMETIKSNNELAISFVMKKKIGNAVKRNKIKRKLKAAVQKIIKNGEKINLNYTYVIFGKNTAYKEKFSVISDETKNIFNKIKN